MEDNPYQSPKSAPEVEEGTTKPPSFYGAVAKRFLNAFALMTVLLSVMSIIGVLASAGTPMTTWLGLLGIVAISVVVVALSLWIVRRIR